MSVEAVYNGQDVDFNAQAKTILSSSDWRPCPTPLYDVQEIEIPEWMAPEEYLANVHNWKWYVKIGGSEDLGREAFFKISAVQDGALRLGMVKLLKQKSFKSPFRKSLRMQLDKWIIGESKYEIPFSYKQYPYVVNSYIKLEAKG